MDNDNYDNLNWSHQKFLYFIILQLIASFKCYRMFNLFLIFNLEIFLFRKANNEPASDFTFTVKQSRVEFKKKKLKLCQTFMKRAMMNSQRHKHSVTLIS